MTHQIFTILTGLMTLIGLFVTFFGLTYLITDLIDIYLRFRKQVINRDRKGDGK
jgi:hypothetical protein